MPKKHIPQVALLVETSLSSGRDILAGIGRYVSEHGPWALYAEPHDRAQPPPRWFVRWRGDGIIARVQDARLTRLLLAKRVPVVDVLGVHRPPCFPLVHVDNAAIGRMAAEHLRDRSFTHFAFFGLSDEYWSQERHQAFAAHLRKKGCACRLLTLPRHRMDGTAWRELVTQVAGRLRTLPRPVAILLCSDVPGLLLREACLQAELKIGVDVALLGVGNDRLLCEMNTPTLSSVEPNHFEVGYRAAQLLARLMCGGSAPRRPILVPPLHVAIRESTDFLAVPDAALSRALLFIRARAAEGIGVDDVVRHAFVSRSVLQRRFRSLIGRSIHAEILRERTQQALRLLRETKLSVTEVAAKSGFAYVQSLNKALHRLHGRSAGAHRDAAT